MAAYVFASYDIKDQENYGPYVPGVVPLIARHKGEVLVADYGDTVETMEGETRGVNVILKFPTRQNALDWYNDPDYVPVRQVRFDTCDTDTLFVVDEFVMPAE